MTGETRLRDVVLLAGGSGKTGHACARELSAAGYDTVIAGRSGRGAEALPGPGDGFAFAADLTDENAVLTLRAALDADGLRVGALVHLVGGWAGGKGISGQTDEKYRSLTASFDALRHVSRVFFDSIATAPRPRIVTVSSPLAQHPTASSANYASVKAATEAWTLSLDAALRAENPDGAASIVVTDALAAREESFARLVKDIIDAPAQRVAGRRIAHVS